MMSKKEREELMKQDAIRKIERYAMMCEKFRANAAKQENYYQQDGVKSHLSAAKRNAELADICSWAIVGLRTKL